MGLMLFPFVLRSFEMVRFECFDEVLAKFGIAGIHPACASLPFQTDEQWLSFASAQAELHADGSAVVVDVDADGMLIDGRHRVWWAHIHDVAVELHVVARDQWTHVLLTNMARRDLTAVQRAIFGLGMWDHEHELAKQRREANLKRGDTPEWSEATTREQQVGSTAEIIATRVGCGATTLKAVRRIQMAKPDLIKQLMSLELSLDDALKMIKPPSPPAAPEPVVQAEPVQLPAVQQSPAVELVGDDSDPHTFVPSLSWRQDSVDPEPAPVTNSPEPQPQPVTPREIEPAKAKRPSSPPTGEQKEILRSRLADYVDHLLGSITSRQADSLMLSIMTADEPDVRWFMRGIDQDSGVDADFNPSIAFAKLTDEYVDWAVDMWESDHDDDEVPSGVFALRAGAIVCGRVVGDAFVSEELSLTLAEDMWEYVPYSDHADECESGWKETLSIVNGPSVEPDEPPDDPQDEPLARHARSVLVRIRRVADWLRGDLPLVDGDLMFGKVVGELFVATDYSCCLSADCFEEVEETKELMHQAFDTLHRVRRVERERRAEREALS